MQNERQRILNLVENGTISAEEAIRLLEALEKTAVGQTPVAPVVPEPAHEEQSQQEQQKERTTGFEDLFGKAFNDKEANKKMYEFMQDVKEDLSQFSNRMMGLMNTTISKVKEFDFEFPFGEKVEFNKTYIYEADEVKGFEIDCPSGKLTIEKAQDDKVTVDAFVKLAKTKETEQQTIDDFARDFVTLRDGKLTLATNVKMSAVEMRLKVPAKHYDIIIARILNGSVAINGIDTALLKIKTYNGAIRIEDSQFKRADLTSGNGMIEARKVSGEELEAESMNGRIYIDGELEEIEAESINGAVTLTTTATNAHKIKGSTVAGTVELYIPRNIALDGQVTTNIGKPDVGLDDVLLSTNDDQFLQKTARFSKAYDSGHTLKVSGETRTGSVIVRYNQA